MYLKSNRHSPPTLKQKITWLFGLSYIFIMAIFLLVLYLMIAQVLSEDIDEDLVEDIQQYQSIIEQHGIEALIAELTKESNEEDSTAEFFRLFKNNGNLIYQSDLSDWQSIQRIDRSELVRSIENGKAILRSFDFDEKEYETRVITAYIDDDNILQIGEVMEAKEEVLEVVLSSILILFLIGTPTLLIISTILAGNASKRIGTITDAVNQLSLGNFSVRVHEESGERETQQLAITFNFMVKKIEKLITQMREMTDNIAHDLRSPLARIRAISEMTLTGKQDLADYREAAENTLSECDRLLGLINMTLDVAEAEAGILRTVQTHLNIRSLVEDVCEMYEPLAEQKHIQISTELNDTPEITGNLQSLQRMIANLIDNAIKYTPPHGSVTVRLLNEKTGIRIAVVDSGIGIPSGDQQRVFERFFRCDQSRSTAGSGLGLSYSRAVARAHGGEILLESTPEKQTVFTVLLPT